MQTTWWLASGLGLTCGFLACSGGDSAPGTDGSDPLADAGEPAADAGDAGQPPGDANAEDADAAEEDSGPPCGACVLEPGDVLSVREERYPTPEMGTPEYLALAEVCPAIVLDRVLGTDAGAGRFNHTILITEGGLWPEARYVHASDPGGVFETDLGPWVLEPQTPCGWRYLRAEVYRPPAGYAVSRAEAVANARSYIGETYALIPSMISPETWAHFRDDPDAELLDLLTYEGIPRSLALLGETTWDFTLAGVTEFMYSQPRFCGATKLDTEDCGMVRNCNICPPPGGGTKYCSELIWWSYGGFDGVRAAGTEPAGVTGRVPDLYDSSHSGMTSVAHTSDDNILDFEVKCAEAPFDELQLVDAQCP